MIVLNDDSFVEWGCVQGFPLNHFPSLLSVGSQTDLQPAALEFVIFISIDLFSL